MIAIRDLFGKFVEKVFCSRLMIEKFEASTHTALNNLLKKKEVIGKHILEFTGTDYVNSKTLPVLLLLLIKEGLEKLKVFTRTPALYMKSIIDWKKFLLVYYSYIGVITSGVTPHPDYILCIEILIELLLNPLDTSHVIQFKALIDDLTEQNEVLLHIDLRNIKANKKNTFEDIRQIMVTNEEIIECLHGISGIEEEKFRKTVMSILTNYSEFYLLRKTSNYGKMIFNRWSKTLRNGMIYISEVYLPLFDEAQAPPLMLARAFMAIFHELINIVRLLKNGKRLISPPPDPLDEDPEYIVEKRLFGRHNFLHMLGDQKQNNQAVLNKLAKIILDAKQWEEDAFCYTLKNWILQVTCREYCGFEAKKPSFEACKRRRPEGFEKKAKKEETTQEGASPKHSINLDELDLKRE